MTQDVTPPTIGGITMAPLTLGTIRTLSRVGSAFATMDPENPVPVSMDELALAAIVFAKPEWCREMLHAGQKDKIMAEADEFSFKLDSKAMHELLAFINAGLADFFPQTSQP